MTLQTLLWHGELGEGSLLQVKHEEVQYKPVYLAWEKKKKDHQQRIITLKKKKSFFAVS